jgi:hypothetical protein
LRRASIISWPGITHPRKAAFVSVDPLIASAHASLPQTWNRYSYVLNNPLALTDSTGMVVDTMGDDELEAKKAEQAQKQTA